MPRKLSSYLKNAPSISAEHKNRIRTLEDALHLDIGHPFLYVRALRHRSSLPDGASDQELSYERLEFLGDAVLDLIVSEIIFDKYLDRDEGFLTKLRSQIVKGDSLAAYAKKLGLSELIIIGDRSKGQGIEFSKSALADVFESLLGAIYVDLGYNTAVSFIERIIDSYVDFDSITARLNNYKSSLLEFSQAHSLGIPHYELLGESGPDHNKTFQMTAVVNDKQEGKGTGKSKKDAEQEAAKNALKALQKKF